MKEIETIGPSNQGNVCSLTFQSVAARQRFVAGAPQNRHVLRLHWVPYSVPMAVITIELRKNPGLKVLSANFEIAVLDSRASVGLRHSVRTLVRINAVECPSP